MHSCTHAHAHALTFSPTPLHAHTRTRAQVWHLDETCGRSTATGHKWIEDTNWTLSLDAAWNLDVVRRLARQMVNHFNDEGMLAILDDGTEHRHRMAFSADLKAMEHVTKQLAESFAREKLEVGWGG